MSAPFTHIYSHTDRLTGWQILSYYILANYTREMVAHALIDSSNEVAIDRYKRIFHRFASVERNGQKFMTRDDFVNAIAPGEDYKRLQRSQYGVLFDVADQGKHGLLSLSDL